MSDWIDVEDPHGLLAGSATPDKAGWPEPLHARFEQILDFESSNERLPSRNSEDLREALLGTILETILATPGLKENLEQHGWQTEIQRLSEEVADALTDVTSTLDPFGLLLSAKTTGIRRIKHVSKIPKRPADFVARRKPCTDFDAFATGFKDVLALLESGALIPVAKKSTPLKSGEYFVLQDLLGFVEYVSLSETKEEFASGPRVRNDGRTRVIFENGTESNLLLRSLEKAIALNGYFLSKSENSTDSGGNSADGYLYVVRSRRDFSGQNYPIHKIGFTRTTIERRLNKAKTEAAYLFGEVELVASYRCEGIDPSKLESILHKFFVIANVEIRLEMGGGNVLKPKEWFRVSLDDIDLAINLAMDEKLHRYTFDLQNGIASKP